VIKQPRLQHPRLALLLVALAPSAVVQGTHCIASAVRVAACVPSPALALPQLKLVTVAAQKWTAWSRLLVHGLLVALAVGGLVRSVGGA
jgi:hypothetical protein